MPSQDNDVSSRQNRLTSFKNKGKDGDVSMSLQWSMKIFMYLLGCWVYIFYVGSDLYAWGLKCSFSLKGSAYCVWKVVFHKWQRLERIGAFFFK